MNDVLYDVLQLAYVIIWIHESEFHNILDRGLGWSCSQSQRHWPRCPNKWTAPPTWRTNMNAGGTIRPKGQLSSWGGSPIGHYALCTTSLKGSSPTRSVTLATHVSTIEVYLGNFGVAQWLSLLKNITQCMNPYIHFTTYHIVQFALF